MFDISLLTTCCTVPRFVPRNEPRTTIFRDESGRYVTRREWRAIAKNAAETGVFHLSTRTSKCFWGARGRGFKSRQPDFSKILIAETSYVTCRRSAVQP